jgi:hypothetical protein
MHRRNIQGRWSASDAIRRTRNGRPIANRNRYEIQQPVNSGFLLAKKIKTQNINIYKRKVKSLI